MEKLDYSFGKTHFAVDSAGWSGGSATLTSQGFNRDEDLSNIKWVEGVNDWDELDRFR